MPCRKPRPTPSTPTWWPSPGSSGSRASSSPPTGRPSPATSTPCSAAAFSAGTDLSRALARHILWFEHRTVPPPIVRAGRVLAVTTLDPRLLHGLGLRLDAGDEAYGRRLDQRLRTYYPRLPRARAGLPTLYVALRRPTVGLAERVRAVRRSF